MFRNKTTPQTMHAAGRDGGCASMVGSSFLSVVVQRTDEPTGSDDVSPAYPAWHGVFL